MYRCLCTGVSFLIIHKDDPKRLSIDMLSFELARVDDFAKRIDVDGKTVNHAQHRRYNEVGKKLIIALSMTPLLYK